VSTSWTAFCCRPIACVICAPRATSFASCSSSFDSCSCTRRFSDRKPGIPISEKSGRSRSMISRRPPRTGGSVTAIARQIRTEPWSPVVASSSSHTARSHVRYTDVSSRIPATSLRIQSMRLSRSVTTSPFSRTRLTIPHRHRGGLQGAHERCPLIQCSSAIGDLMAPPCVATRAGWDCRRRRRGPQVRQERGPRRWINRAKRTARRGRTTPSRGAMSPSVAGVGKAGIAGPRRCGLAGARSKD
jgi:hypothetical protein